MGYRIFSNTCSFECDLCSGVIRVPEKLRDYSERSRSAPVNRASTAFLVVARHSAQRDNELYD